MTASKIFKIGGLQIASVFGYFWVVRPLRGAFSRWCFSSGFFSPEILPENITTVQQEGITVHIYYLYQQTELIFSYAPQFGFFFLLALIGIIFFSPSLHIYLSLVGFHIAVEMSAQLGLFLGFKGVAIGFICADFILLYLSPMVSLGFIVFVSMSKNQFGNSSV